MQYIDTYELTRLGSTVQGQAPIARFTRLTADLPEQSDASVAWAVTGETDARGQRFLRVAVKAAPVLECQRCMQRTKHIENRTNAHLLTGRTDESHGRMVCRCVHESDTYLLNTCLDLAGS